MKKPGKSLPQRRLPLKPEKPFENALYDFMCMSKGESQSLMIRYFLEQVIEHSDLCDQGSILVYSPRSGKSESDGGSLKLIDRATNANSLIDFPGADFKVDQGLAGLVFRKRVPEFAPYADAHPDFIPIEKQDIGAIYCLPIILVTQQPPFGIVSFHNSRASTAEIGDDTRLRMRIAAKALEAVLPQAPIPLVPQEKLFIVHGHNEMFLRELAQVLESEDVPYVVVQTFARTGQDLLGFIENRIRGCVAGFVLLTADDEGRLYRFGEPLRQRARQNVIFEAGYLTALFRRTNRICFLQQGDLEIPSDLNGLLMEQVDTHVDRERIILTLEEWGIATKSGREAEAKKRAQEPAAAPEDSAEMTRSGET
jgi:predicted nucleotide-binding protein